MRASGPGAAAGRGGGAGGQAEDEVQGASAAAAATPVPEKATKSVAAHDGGCFTCAFDRSELAGLSSPYSPWSLKPMCALWGQGMSLLGEG